MKKISVLMALSLALLCVSSCLTGGKKDEPKFDETFLYGQWQSGSLFYSYASNHTGKTWDEADDVTEDEAMSFEWSLVNAEFTHIYVTEISASGTKASVPKVYTVTTLTQDTLVYEDDFGKVFSFSKVK